MTKIAHLTSVHPPFDTRIFHKECKTLVRAGYKVVLIVPHERDETVDGVRIRAVPKPRSRLTRMTRTAWQVYLAARMEDADLYHFHDPELIPVALLLQRSHKPVVYDVHEDYGTSIKIKPYIPAPVRSPLASLFQRLEQQTSKGFELVLAERYYTKIFPDGTVVLNLPVRSDFESPSVREPGRDLLYAGVVVPARGARIYAEIAARMNGVHVHLVGRCGEILAQELLSIADGEGRLHLEGVGFHVPYSRILEYYSQDKWLAGLAIFPTNPHYVNKELTKLFEYMGAGIPIICSDFPAWRSLIETTGCGVLVDPEDMESILEAIAYLRDNAEDTRAMGMKGRKAFEAQFNWDFEAQKLLGLYERLVG